MEKHLHIICFTVPYPVDYGGVFDLFYKLPALQAAGVHIHLHCYDYGRGRQPELYKYCDQVHYYERSNLNQSFSFKLPHIVNSRNNETLSSELLKDDYPILMEGIHSTWILNDKRFEKRRKFVRLHNIESQYYQQLAKRSNNFFRKCYFFQQAYLLKQYEKKIAHMATAWWGVNEKDVSYYREKLGVNTIDYLSLYLPNWPQRDLEGMGNYCLYHADLSVSANEQTAIWLLKNIFQKIQIPFVIAGKKPSPQLQELAHKVPQTCIVANPSELEMQDMVSKAHINILPSYITTGIKVKLLNALFNGRHLIVNNAAVYGTILDQFSHVRNNASEMSALISQLYHQPFYQKDADQRRALLLAHFNNQQNAQQQVKWIWG